MTTQVPPKRATAYTFLTSLTSQADVKLFQDNPSISAGDVIIIKDGVLDGNIDTLPVAVTSATRVILVSLSATEMTADNVTVLFHDAAGAEWCDLVINIQTTVQQIDDLAATGAAMTLANDAITAAKIAADAIGASELATDAVAEIADAVWDELLSGHALAGSAGLALTGADTLGSGAISTAITINDGVNPIDGVEVWITTDLTGTNVVASGVTDALGLVTFMLDAGAYFCWKQRAGFNFTNPQAMTVS